MHQTWTADSFHIWYYTCFNAILPNPYMTTGKTVALTRQTFVGKVMSLLFNMLSQFSSVQFSCSIVSESVTPWIAARQASLSITNSRSLLKLRSIELVMLSSHLILCCPLHLLPSIFPSIRVSSVYMLVPVSQLIQPLSLFLGIHKFLLYICVSISALPSPRIMKMKTKINKST